MGGCGPLGGQARCGPQALRAFCASRIVLQSVRRAPYAAVFPCGAAPQVGCWVRGCRVAARNPRWHSSGQNAAAHAPAAVRFRPSRAAGAWRVALRTQKPRRAGRLCGLSVSVARLLRGFVRAARFAAARVGFPLRGRGSGRLAPARRVFRALASCPRIFGSGSGWLFFSGNPNPNPKPNTHPPPPRFGPQRAIAFCNACVQNCHAFVLTLPIVTKYSGHRWSRGHQPRLTRRCRALEVVMPIFEYICRGCGKKFEAIVYGSKRAECPACKGTDLAQQLSTFAAHGTDRSSASAPKMPCGMPVGSCGGGGCCEMH